MKCLLACRINGQTMYLSEAGYLTPNRAMARVFLSRSNAEYEVEKRQRRPRPLRGEKLYLSPVREDRP
jgi:hypothetical protein